VEPEEGRDYSQPIENNPGVASTSDPMETPSDQDEGREFHQIPVPINSIKIPEHVWTPSSDILAEPADAAPEVKAPIASIDVDDDPDVYCAQIDTGAFMTCTDQKHLLHGYSTYSEKQPSPVQLLPATDGSDVVPEGHGYLHVPAEIPRVFLLSTATITPVCACIPW
jgi:hypothetical protein